MKKQINDLLLKMQTGENCIGETANKLLDLYSVSITEGESCEICNENQAKVIYKTCYACEEYIINGEHN